MLRIICRDTDATEVVHANGQYHVRYRTFDVELPEVEAYLARVALYGHRAIMGAEIIPPKA